MIRTYYKLSYLFIMAIVVWSCQKAEPDNETVDNSRKFSIVAGIQNDITTYASDQGGVANVDKDIYDQRYILEIYDGSDRIFRKVQCCEIGESVSFDMRLLAKKYTFALWADFTINGSEEDNLYNTANGLDEVTYNGKVDLEMLSKDYADAYCFVEDVDLRSSGINIKNMVLERPLGKIRFLANKTSNTPQPAVSKITFTEQNIPTTYNVLTGNSYGSYVSNELFFDAVLETTSIDGSEKEGYLLGNIYVFSNIEEKIYQVNITTFADENQETKIGEHTLDVPVKSNKLTTVTGNFFN